MNKLAVLSQYVRLSMRKQFKSKDALWRYQQKKIQKHLQFVMKNSPFYRNYYEGYEVAVEQSATHLLPTIDKNMMMEHFDELNTIGIQKKFAMNMAIQAERTRDFSPMLKGISIGLSSGTSGNRGLFLVSKQEQAMWVGAVLAHVVPSPLRSRHKIAFFLRANNNLYEGTKSNRLSFSFFDLAKPFSEHRESLQELQPTILVAPASALRHVSEWQQKGIVDISPQKIIAVAEVLEDIDKAYIESVFNQRVHQVYQCTEGFLASTCEHGTLHINEHIIRIEKEYLDEENGVFVPIITDFTRTSQPIIRYRLNDILVERKHPTNRTKSYECPCGSVFTALERIDGRCDDMFYGESNGNGKPIPLFPDFIRRAMLFASDEISEYKVIQHDMQDIEIQVQLQDDTRQQIVEVNIIGELHRYWNEHDLVLPSFRFGTYEEMVSDKKRKRIESRWKGPTHDSLAQ